MTNSYRKEYPFAGYAGFGGGAPGLSFKSAASKTYVDDIFSPYVYSGNSSTQSISNGVDLSGEGGLVWTKIRNLTYGHFLFDTENGNGNYIRSDLGDAKATYDTSGTNAGITEFNSTGYSLGADQSFQCLNYSGNDYTSWTFRKAPGFFDVVTWSGNSTAGRQISHNLGCVPGAIFTKRLNLSENWLCYHRGMGNEKYIHLNLTNEMGDATYFNDTDPTSTYFTVNDAAQINGTGYSYVAYVFAGGQSGDTSRSVYFDGVGDYLHIGPSSDFTMGTGDFTVECWIKKDDLSQGGIFQISDVAGGLDYSSAPAIAWTGSQWHMYASGDHQVTGPGCTANKWTHVAMVRESGVSKLYVDGEVVINVSNTTDYSNETYIAIGGYFNASYLHEGYISNFRVVKGTAVYTSNFKPQRKQLENITGTVLLCCNNSSVTGSTVTPGTITAEDSPTASSDSPGLNDPSSFVFGENEDQNLITCGSYTGNGNAAGPTVDLGWEPQFLLIKRIDTNGGQWAIFDSMRGISTDLNDVALYANNTDADTDYEYLSLTPTGFKLNSSSGDVNDNTKDYIYIAIRRPDGYVGKPPESANEVFDMDNPGDGTPPSYESTTLDIVDFAFMKVVTGTSNWFTPARLIQGSRVRTNSDAAAESFANTYNFDYRYGWSDFSSAGSYMSWMWKRGQGFDVVTYTGNGTAGHSISHSLSKTPEMIWCKERSGTGSWWVYHKGLDGGNEPWTHYLVLNTSVAEDDYPIWNDTAPTSTHFTIGSHGEINGSSDTYIAMLFASVDGISKVGYYDGSNSEQTITTGFQPRFLIIKRIDSGYAWFVLDTTRGWGSGNDSQLELNTTNAASSHDFGAPTATGFTLTSFDSYNISGGKFIYYAHA